MLDTVGPGQEQPPIVHPSAPSGSMEFAQDKTPGEVVTPGAHTDIDRMNMAADLEFAQVNTAILTLEQEMLNIPTSTKDSNYRLLCDDIQQSHRRLEEYEDSLLTQANKLAKQLLIAKIKEMQNQFTSKVAFKSGILPQNRLVRPRDLMNSDDDSA